MSDWKVYEVELPTIPPNRLLQHIKASSPEEACALVEAIQGVQSIGVTVWRDCTDAEAAVCQADADAKAADDAAKAQLDAENAAWQEAHK